MRAVSSLADPGETVERRFGIVGQRESNSRAFVRVADRAFVGHAHAAVERDDLVTERDQTARDQPVWHAGAIVRKPPLE